MNLLQFTDQFEITDMYEDPDEEHEYRKKVLRDRGVTASFEHEAPRENKGSQWALNLRDGGKWGATELPYVHGDYDISFRDHDPRGWNDEHDWKKMRRDAAPRASLTLWGKDGDASIPGEGIAPVDMMQRLVEARRILRERINWFSESLGAIAAGKTTGATNRPSEVGMGVTEDRSQAIDPTMFDSVSAQNINRFLSNNLHVGGKYFAERTTPDHVIPIASYGYLFRISPGDIGSTIGKDMMEEIKTLGLKSANKGIARYLEGRSDHAVADKKNSRGLEAKNISPIICDIMALVGVTQNEIRWITSRETANKSFAHESLAHVVGMIQGLEKLPPGALLNIRNSLLREHAPEFRGGLDTRQDHKRFIKNILESRNKSGNCGGVSNVLAREQPGSLAPKPNRTAANRVRGVGSAVASLFGINLDQPFAYETIVAQKSSPVYSLARPQVDGDFCPAESSFVANATGAPLDIGQKKMDILREEIDAGSSELAYETELKSWSESHLNRGFKPTIH